MGRAEIEQAGGDSFRDGARAILPYAIAGSTFGASFGVLAKVAGMGSVAPIVMSATTFGGSAQYAAFSVLDAGGGAAAAIAAAVLLNARYAPISISVGPVFEGPAWRRFLEAQLKLPTPVIGVVSLLTPALLAARVATKLLGGDRELVLDERLAGLAAAVVALVLRAPILVVVVVAAATTAIARGLL